MHDNVKKMHSGQFQPKMISVESFFGSGLYMHFDYGFNLVQDIDRCIILCMQYQNVFKSVRDGGLTGLHKVL